MRRSYRRLDVDEAEVRAVERRRLTSLKSAAQPCTPSPAAAAAARTASCGITSPGDREGDAGLFVGIRNDRAASTAPWCRPHRGASHIATQQRSQQHACGDRGDRAPVGRVARFPAASQAAGGVQSVIHPDECSLSSAFRDETSIHAEMHSSRRPRYLPGVQ